MRLRYILMVAAVTCLASSDALSVDGDATLSKVEDLNHVHDIRGEDDAHAKRFLRAHETVDADSDDVENSDDEERALPKFDWLSEISQVSDDIGQTAAKLTRSKSLPNFNPLDDLAAAQKYLDLLEAKNNVLFKHIVTNKKIDPLKLRDQLGISKKLKTMTMEQLSNDGGFLFWMMFKRYHNANL